MASQWRPQMWRLRMVCCKQMIILAQRPFAIYGTALFILGLSVHVLMLLRAPLDPAINQSEPATFTTLLSVLRREQYPPIAFFPRRADLVWQIQYYYNFFMEQWYFVGDKASVLSRISLFIGPIFLGLLGVVHGIRRLYPVFLMLLTNYLVNADLLNLYLNFTDHEVRERDYFYFTAFMFFAIFIGMGASALLRYASGPEGRSARELAKIGSGEGDSGARVVTGVPVIRAGLLTKLTAAFLIVMAMLPVLIPGHTKWYEHDRSENTIAYEDT